MIFRIHDDVVERKLDLIGRRTILQAAVQLVLVLAIVGFATVFIGAAGSKMVSNLPPNWITRFDCWWRLLLALSIMGVPALLICGLALRIVMTASDGCRRLTIDERTGELTAILRGGLLGFRSRVSIPLAEIRRIDLHAGPGGSALALKLTVHSAKQLARQPLEADVRVRHVDRREEALDLLLRIARSCGLTHYAVEGSDVRNLRLRAVREGKTSDKFQPIPAAASAARYEDNFVSPGITAPPLAVGKFSRALFSKSVHGTLLKEWKPGERIHFHEPPADWMLYAVAAGAACVGAGFLSYNTAHFFRDWLPGWGTMAVAMTLAPLIACIVVFFAYREREIVLDWPTGTIAWRRGRLWRHAELRQIDRLLLRGLKRHISQKKRRSYTKYSCRLDLYIGGRRVFLAQTNEHIDDPDTPANQLGSLAAALAEAVGVSWQWRDYDAWR